MEKVSDLLVSVWAAAATKEVRLVLAWGVVARRAHRLFRFAASPE